MKTANHTRFYSLLKSPMKLNLQLFAEGGEGDGGNEENDNESEFKAPQSQSELDSVVGTAVNKALANAKAKWEEEAKMKIEDAKTQAEKLAQMTEAERNAEAEKERLEKLEERERELNKRELKVAAIDILAEKGLSPKLADVLNYTDENTAKEHIDLLEEVLKELIKEGVDKKLASSVDLPAGNGGSAKAKTRAERYAEEANKKETTKTSLWG